jgi:hypothetical protein
MMRLAHLKEHAMAESSKEGNYVAADGEKREPAVGPETSAKKTQEISLESAKKILANFQSVLNGVKGLLDLIYKLGKIAVELHDLFGFFTHMVTQELQKDMPTEAALVDDPEQWSQVLVEATVVMERGARVVQITEALFDALAKALGETKLTSEEASVVARNMAGVLLKHDLRSEDIANIVVRGLELSKRPIAVSSHARPRA